MYCSIVELLPLKSIKKLCKYKKANLKNIYHFSPVENKLKIIKIPISKIKKKTLRHQRILCESTKSFFYPFYFFTYARFLINLCVQRIQIPPPCSLKGENNAAYSAIYTIIYL